MPFIANPVHGLSLGGLQFVANGQTVVYTDAPSGDTYKFNVLDTDTQWGNAEPVTETLLSMLTDGSQVTYLRDDNREPSLSVLVEASGAAGLAAAEVALRAVTYKACRADLAAPVVGVREDRVRRRVLASGSPDGLAR
jgi:hypothetical protein